MARTLRHHAYGLNPPPTVSLLLEAEGSGDDDLAGEKPSCKRCIVNSNLIGAAGSLHSKAIAMLKVKFVMLPDTALLGKIVSIPHCVTDAVQHRAGLTASVPGTRSFRLA